QPRGAPGKFARYRAGKCHWREETPGDGRPLLGGERETTFDGGARGEESGRDDPARRGVQAADLAVRIPGAWVEGIEAFGQGAAGDGTGDHHGIAIRGPRGDGGGVHGHHPDRGAQCAELPVADRGGADGEADFVEARAFDADRGMAAGRRVCAVEQQSEPVVLRARDTDVRDLYA